MFCIDSKKQCLPSSDFREKYGFPPEAAYRNKVGSFSSMSTLYNLSMALQTEELKENVAQLIRAITVVNPHQRCVYSDLAFARKDTSLYCSVWKWVGWRSGVVSPPTK